MTAHVVIKRVLIRRVLIKSTVINRAIAAVLLLAGVLPLLAVDGARAETLKPAHHEAHVTLDPASGSVRLDNRMVVEGEGPVALGFLQAYDLETLSIDGVRHAPRRQGDALIVDVGFKGRHTIRIQARASLSPAQTAGGPPFLGEDGGFLDVGWLGNPKGQPATYRIEVDTRLPHVAVMPGTLKTAFRKQGRHQAVFTSDRPGQVPVLITGPFEVREHLLGGEDGVRIRTYFHGELAQLADGYLRDAAQYIRHYETLIGEYPHPGFAMVSGPLPVGIGLEGMTYMGRRVLALPFIRHTSLPHEVLHNWWGNAVYIDYAQGNWAEGLTTYMADHAQAEAAQDGGGAEKRLEWLRNFAALSAADDRPLRAFTAKSHDASQVVGYGKVAFVFHMLNIRLGREPFRAAIREFYAQNRGAFADWTDVRDAFETASGEDLDAFFEAWTERPGAPRIELAEAEADGGTLTFVLSQTQETDAFPVTVPVRVTLEDGATYLYPTMTAKREAFTFEADAPVRAVAVDPHFDVFRRLHPGEVAPILRDVTLKGDVALVRPGTDEAAQNAADQLAGALLEYRPKSAPDDDAPKGPAIIAGLKADVQAYVRRFDLPGPPGEIADLDAQALAYVAKLNAKDGAQGAVLVAWAKDGDALAALARVLGHYKRRGYVAMQDGRVTHKGTPTAQAGPVSELIRRFDVAGEK